MFFTATTENMVTKLHHDEFCERQLEYHCIARNLKCKVIFEFLASNGRFGIMENLQILYEEAIKSFFNTYVETFDELINKIVFPTFEARFSSRRTRNNGNETIKLSQITHIKGRNCYKLEGDYHIALFRLGNMLQKFYNKFHVLNLEFDPQGSKSRFGWSRYFGSLMASLNYDIDSENMKSSFRSKNIQKDLIQLMNAIIPSTKLTLTDVIGLLGYTNKVTPNNRKDELDFDNSNTGDSRNSSYIKNNSHDHTRKLYGLESFYETENLCDLEMYSNQWRQFFKSLSEVPKGKKYHFK